MHTGDVADSRRIKKIGESVADQGKGGAVTEIGPVLSFVIGVAAMSMFVSSIALVWIALILSSIDKKS